MITPLVRRALTPEEVERGALLLTREAAERIRGRPGPLCARVEDETRMVRLVEEEGEEGEARFWLEGLLPGGVRAGDEVVAHEGAEDYCLAAAIRRGR